MLQSSEKWRLDFKVEELVENFGYVEGDAIQQIYKRFHHKTDKLGRPIYFECFKDM
jgi:hypothetical protein